MSTNGGLYEFNPRVSTKLFFRAEDTHTDTGVVASGQVLKALSFVESNADGKLIAHSGMTESAILTFATITTGQTLILAGLTFTAGSGSVTAAELVTIWKDLPAGITATNANLLLLARGINATTKGTFTSGTLTQYTTSVWDASNLDSIVFSGYQAFTNLTDVGDTGTATNPVVTLKAPTSAIAPIAGILLYDVDASAADTKAEVYKEGSFWADALTWAVDSTATTGDVMTKADGTTVAFTAYNTGLAGNNDTTNLLRRKFVEGTEYEPLGFLTLGEIANG